MVDIMADMFDDFLSKRQGGQFALELMLGSSVAQDHSRQILRSLNDREFTVRTGSLDGRHQQNRDTAGKLAHAGIGALVGLLLSRRYRTSG